MKRKASDSTNYKYDMYDSRGSKRYKSKPATRKRTWKEFGRQAVGTAAASTLGFIGANTGGAIVAGRKTWDYLAPDLKVEEEDNMTPLLEAAGIYPKKTMVGTSYTTGKFNKLGRPSSEVNHITKYQKNGILINKEVYGQIASPDCVYLTHSTYDQIAIAQAIGSAILRKIFKKGGYNVTSVTERLPLQDDQANSENFKFQMNTALIDSQTLSKFEWITINTDTIETMLVKNFNGQGFSLYDFIKASLQASELSTLQLIDNIVLYSRDRYEAEGSNFRLAASLNMKNEILQLYSKSTMIVQNRTKSASGASETEVVDNQPLKGTLYQFAGGVPQSKQYDNFRINRMNDFAVLLNRAQDLTPSNDFKVPPVPKYFNNCYKSTGISLNPGNIKHCTISSTWSGYINNILFGSLTCRRGINLMINTPGKSQMVGLQETINSGSTNLITCTYEASKVIGANLISGPTPVCLPKFEEVNYNLIV